MTHNTHICIYFIEKKDQIELIPSKVRNSTVLRPNWEYLSEDLSRHLWWCTTGCEQIIHGWHTCSCGHRGAKTHSAAFESLKRKGRRLDIADLWCYKSTFDKEREEEVVSVETNGRFPLVYMWALRDWVGNWAWNVFTLMDQITCFYFVMCQSQHPWFVSAALVHIISLKILINVCSDEKLALLRFCLTDVPMIPAAFTPAYSDGTLTHHFPICPSTKMKRCGFSVCSIIPLFFSALPPAPVCWNRGSLCRQCTQLSEDWWNYIAGQGK